jgi:hypothetical protein
MKCSPCGADNPAGLKFCGQCGAALGTACPSCGAGNPPGHRFCGQCGAPLYAPSSAEPAPPKPNIAKPQTPRSVSTLPAEKGATMILDEARQKLAA